MSPHIITFKSVSKAAKQYAFHRIGNVIRKEICNGCNTTNSRSNEHEHRNPVGCLQPWENMPDEVIMEIYNRVDVESVEHLINLLIHQCNVNASTATVIEISPNEIKEYFSTNELEWGHIHQLCSELCE